MAIPSNLKPVNASDISGSIQSIAGQFLGVANIPEIEQFSVLNTVLPDSLFTTGSLDQIKDRTIAAAETYINGLPAPRLIPEIPASTVPFPPRRPSYGQIKNFIKTKIDRIKRQRQQASLKALDEKLKQRENPFAYQQSLKNTQVTAITNNILGRFNNQ